MSHSKTEAIKNYLVIQAWQIQVIKKAVEKADSQDTKFVNHDDVVDWVDSWDTT